MKMKFELIDESENENLVCFEDYDPDNNTVVISIGGDDEIVKGAKLSINDIKLVLKKMSAK